MLLSRTTIDQLGGAMSVENQVAPAGDISSNHAAADMPDAEHEVRAVETDPTRRYSRVRVAVCTVFVSGSV